MSECIRSLDSKKIASIPTQKDDITIQWVFLLVNQYLLKHGKPALDGCFMKDLNFEVHDCKSSVGDFSSTYALNVTVPNGKYVLTDLVALYLLVTYINKTYEK